MTGYAMLHREQLLQALEAFAKNWLAHDGSWFLAAEERFGVDTAIKLGATAGWRLASQAAFTEVARRPGATGD
jgi:hypothetical protein